MREHLQAIEPERPEDADLRGFEWYYLRRLCDATCAGPCAATPARSTAWRSAPTAAAWSPPATEDGTVKIWDVGSGQLIRSQAGPSDGVICVAYSPDGRRIATAGGSDSTVRLWDAASGALIRTLRGHAGWVVSRGV